MPEPALAAPDILIPRGGPEVTLLDGSIRVLRTVTVRCELPAWVVAGSAVTIRLARGGVVLRSFEGVAAGAVFSKLWYEERTNAPQAPEELFPASRTPASAWFEVVTDAIYTSPARLFVFHPFQTRGHVYYDPATQETVNSVTHIRTPAPGFVPVEHPLSTRHWRSPEGRDYLDWPPRLSREAL
jgi:hypothetical protein